jgi:DNA-binding NarL/FixJ family response regulator
MAANTRREPRKQAELVVGPLPDNISQPTLSRQVGEERTEMAQRILLADDVPAVRQGVRALLETDGFEVVGEAENGREAVRLAQDLLPDIAILDLSMPELNGIEAALEIQQGCPQTHQILLTVHTEEYQIVAALRAGIRGYVVKAEVPEELIRAIGEVSRGGVFLSPIASRVIDVLHPKDDCHVRPAPQRSCAPLGAASAPPSVRGRQGPPEPVMKTKMIETPTREIPGERI